MWDLFAIGLLLAFLVAALAFLVWLAGWAFLILFAVILFVADLLRFGLDGMGRRIEETRRDAP